MKHMLIAILAGAWATGLGHRVGRPVAIGSDLPCGK
jgi:hypothetical protein